MHDSHDHTVDGIHYPTHYLVGVIDDLHEADTAAQDLRQAGFADQDITVFHGQESLAAIEAKEQSQGVFARVLQAIENAEDEADRQAYLASLRRGASNVLVHTPEPEQLQRAKAILERHHAYGISYLGAASVERFPS